MSLKETNPYLKNDANYERLVRIPLTYHREKVQTVFDYSKFAKYLCENIDWNSVVKDIVKKSNGD